MTYYEMSRWMALIEGVNLIADNVEDESIEKLHITIALKEYVDQTSNKICRQLMTENKATSPEEICHV